MILQKGKLQVSDKERAHHLQNTFKDVATIVSQKCVNKSTGLPFTVATIEAAMKKKLKYAVVPSRSAKQQALDVIAKLRAHLPIQRVKMKLSCTVAAKDVDSLVSTLEETFATIVEKKIDAQKASVVVFVEPHHFRTLNATIPATFGADASVEVLDADESYAAAEEGVDLEEATRMMAQMSGDRNEKRGGAGKRSKAKRQAAKHAQGKAKTLSCRTCGVDFGLDRTLQRDHYKSELHRMNLKMKERGAPPIAEEELLIMDEAMKDEILHNWRK